MKERAVVIEELRVVDWKKYTIATLILVIILLTGCDEPPNTTQSAAVNSNKGNSTTVTADVQFRVMDQKSQPIENAKILIINGDGKVIHEETSDKNGIAQKKLTVPMIRGSIGQTPTTRPQGVVLQ
ncbi:hypothetical protein CEB3_c26870 [Peptococcaceae bacterium CEB3]|nr:hypothetical protein CEB3_c26870 [Peptococcaceae bacterium CEB3]